MIKIFPVEKIREADAYTIKNEPISSVDLMERAATQCFDWIHNRKPHGKTIKIFCGTGNNGGDGLVVARLLASETYKCEVFITGFSDRFTEDFLINQKRLEAFPSVPVTVIKDGYEFPEIGKDDLVIDAIFGSGLSKPVLNFPSALIEHINNSGAVIIAVDIPSGLFADKLPSRDPGSITRADYTLTFQFPKLSFFYAETEQYVGEWHVLPIGLHPEFISKNDTTHFLSEPEDIRNLIKTRNRFSHKGNFGHALLIAGSYGKMGAAIIAAKACLRSGAGLVTAHIPKKGYEIMQTGFPEAMVSVDEEELCFSGIKDLSAYNAIGIGPGIGTHEQTQNALKLLIQNSGFPLVLDADALNILSENRTWLSFLPPGSILTPHVKEFERLTSKANDALERNQMQIEFSKKYNVYVVLKGAFTSVSTPDGKCYFNPSGNPGMATGGSGDVLTGIILSLLAQGYTPFTACITGVYLHGLAGDIAAESKGYEALIAGDIIDNLGEAFQSLYNLL